MRREESEEKRERERDREKRREQVSCGEIKREREMPGPLRRLDYCFLVAWFPCLHGYWIKTEKDVEELVA